VTRKAGSYLFAFLLITPPLAAQWLKYPTPGIPRLPDGKPNLTAPALRTADGKPDLSGIWGLTTNAGGVRQLKPSEIKPWALELVKEREETLFRDSPVDYCLPAGPGPMGGLDKIVQTPALILILREDLTYRQIFLDGRELPKDPNPAWMGYSVGRWEGDVFVVNSLGFDERTWLDHFGNPVSDDMTLEERYHRVDRDTLELTMTINAPKAYTKPWISEKKTFRLAPATTELEEIFCVPSEEQRFNRLVRDPGSGIVPK